MAAKSTAQPTTYTPPSPSLRLLFSYLTVRDVWVLLFPAIVVAIIGGGIAPFMTRVLGQVFDALAFYPLNTNVSEAERQRELLHTVAVGSLELVALAVGTLVLSSVMATLWMWVGERNAMRLRAVVYTSVTLREMEWFDLKTGDDDDGDSGAGGLMAKFTSTTDDVRMATSLSAGMLIQYATTFVTCLVLALQLSWSLTLVILSSIPLLVLVQMISQALAVPLYGAERATTTKIGTLVSRSVKAISTVKAFNAETFEISLVQKLLEEGRKVYTKCWAVWGVTAGLTQFILFAMFAQGFWFGAHLVRSGKLTSGNVMAVFWACLVGASNLQLCVPLLVVLTKGKGAMVELDTLINTPSPTHPGLVSSPNPTSPVTRKSFRQAEMAKIVPHGKTHGAFSLHNIQFSYISRPGQLTLDFEEMYLPSGETTFIVGASGSGKSTIAQLLLGLYLPQSGTILLDDRDMRFLDDAWLRRHVGSVSQTCVLFDMTVAENVAIGVESDGRRRQDVTREEIEKVCTAALMHEFVRDLPEGYDTPLGAGGASLSGGQRQRLAIARALLRDPTILILDEATSALDATSRVLVFEAIKRHRDRADRTTIVITHDLSQITAEDFVYVMKNGQVVERGFRQALEETIVGGEFRRMLDVQTGTGGFKVKDDVDLGLAYLEDEFGSDYEDEDDEEEEKPERGPVAGFLKRISSIGRGSKRFTSRKSFMFNSAAHKEDTSEDHEDGDGAPKWMFDAVADLANPQSSAAIQQAVRERRTSNKLSKQIPPTSLRIKTPILRRGSAPEGKDFEPEPRPSLQFEPVSPVHAVKWSKDYVDVDEEFEREKEAMRATGDAAGAKRRGRPVRGELRNVVVDGPTPAKEKNVPQPTLFGMFRKYYSTVPNKWVIFLGVFMSMVSGALAPVFSVVLSNLQAVVGNGAKDTSLVSRWGMWVIVVAAGDGFAAGMRFFIMEIGSMKWISDLRKKAYEIVLSRDKTWFDQEGNEPERIVQIITKDADDTCLLISNVLMNLVVVTTMLGVGLIWALVRGWQLTLVSFAIGPVFALAMMGQSTLMTRYETRAKRAREDVAKRYFDAVSNVRAIRSMNLQHVFQAQYDQSLQEALKAGVTGSMVAGTGFGVSNALVYFSEALLFYVGAVLMAKNVYSYLQLLETINLVIFTVSLAAQLLAFVPKISRATVGANDYDKLLSAATQHPSRETTGDLKFPIAGDINFDHVTFHYPTRPDVPVLRDVSFSIRDGECVAIVGASGSGKSTIAGLMQRLYEPDAGSIRVGQYPLGRADVNWLRSHVAVVSQHANLFDASIKDNILYGSAGEVPFYEVQRAARDANLEDFINSMPDGYETKLGEDASLISGGQAQRIQLARALVHGKADILILDEFTSALDPTNQEQIMSTVMNVKSGRTTVIVTHKIAVMRRCDRIVVVHEGQIVEQGTYDSLMGRRGQFFTLASAGEWANE